MDEFKLLPEQSALFALSPEEVSLIDYLIGLDITQKFTIDELIVLGSAFCLIASLFITLAWQRKLLNDTLGIQQQNEVKQTKKDELKQQLKELEHHAQGLQQQLNRLKR